MPKEMLFWVLYLICLVFGMVAGYDPAQPVYRRWGGSLAYFILIGVLGWAVFGAPVR
jgi:hypothetical protein